VSADSTLTIDADRFASDLAELNADGAAVRAGAGGRSALASALLAFEGSGVGISPERVDSLLGHPVVWRRPWWLLTASLGSLLSLITLTWEASQAASARATFNLPFVWSQPCLAMLIVLPLLGTLAILGRRVFAVFGGLGIAGYLGHLSWSLFKDSLVFPFALSALGLAIIWIGVLWQRNEARWAASLRGFVPNALRELIEARAVR
jgi:hypothetical protein